MIDASAASENPACVVDSASYVLSPSVGGISMTPSGTITVETTNVKALTSMTVSVKTNGGAETHTFSFPVEVKSCVLTGIITFPKLLKLYGAILEGNSPTINALAISKQTECVVNASGYKI